MKMPEQLLTAKEVAEQLRVTEIYVYNLANSRQIDVILVGRKRYFTQSIVDKYIKDHTLSAKEKQK
jgi:excisionase family DNA binding protein